MARSDVAELLARIDTEYQAMWQGLHGQAIMASHAAITARMEAFADLRDQLVQAMGETEGNNVFCVRYFGAQERQEKVPMTETGV